jgi:hypothetical protein
MPKAEPKWEFRTLQAGDLERDPREGEFFRHTELAEQVVREAIQNSLDARYDGDSTVLVRFTFGSVAPEDVNQYFETLEPHLEASSIPANSSHNGEMTFLTIEDFGTTGLDGSTGEDGSRPEKSNFFDFWFREGISRKGGGVAGRWGLGKTTFHIASGLRSVFGLTVRRDDNRQLLMGKALLKTHKIANQSFRYYGHFAIDSYKPLFDSRAIKSFKKTFLLTRNGEPGLSLVIPLPPEEINVLSVKKAVIFHYFFAIMTGVLRAEIRAANEYVELNDENILGMACSQDWQGSPWEGVNVTELMQFIKDSINSKTDIELHIDDDRPEINEQSFPTEVPVLRDTFNAGDLMTFRVPITITKAGKEKTQTYFVVHLKRFAQLKHSEEFFIRSGIMISDIQTLGSRPVRGLLVAEEEPVTEFLGDAEPPAHTDWNERTEGFKGKYDDAARKLRFIRRSMAQIVSILDSPPQERQRDFLKDVFSVPEKEQNLPAANEKKAGPLPTPSANPPQPNPPLFRIDGKDNGIRITLADKDTKLPLNAKVEVAYDTSTGNPFKQYNPNDFDLTGNQISIKTEGCKVLRTEKNTIRVKVTDADFKLTVSGFDIRRDLLVDGKKEETDETQD